MHGKSSSKSRLPQVVPPGETTISLGHTKSTTAFEVISSEASENSASPTSSTRSVAPSSLLPPPPTPYPWLWQCHRCYTVYQLGCTRRCLECSHELCTEMRPEKPSRLHPRKKDKTTCKSEFDYIAWAAWGAFRRTAAVQADVATKHTLTPNTSDPGCETTRKRRKCRASDSLPTPRLNHDTFALWELAPEEDGGSNTDARSQIWRPLDDAEQEEVVSRKEELYVQRQHSCWLHCDFPSECFRSIHRAWLRARVRNVSEESAVSSHHGNRPRETGNQETCSLTAEVIECESKEAEVNGVGSDDEQNADHLNQHSAFELYESFSDMYRDGGSDDNSKAQPDSNLSSSWSSSGDDDTGNMDPDMQYELASRTISP